MRFLRKIGYACMQFLWVFFVSKKSWDYIENVSIKMDPVFFACMHQETRVRRPKVEYVSFATGLSSDLIFSI